MEVVNLYKLINMDLISYYMYKNALCVENIDNNLFQIEEDLTKSQIIGVARQLFKKFPLAKEILLPSCSSISKKEVS